MGHENSGSGKIWSRRRAKSEERLGSLRRSRAALLRPITTTLRRGTKNRPSGQRDSWRRWAAAIPRH